MLILSHRDVSTMLVGREAELVDLAEAVYAAHSSGLTSIPFSTFLRFPDDQLNRIIGLPAYIGGDSQAAGIKWISSFPGNVANKAERASAVIVLNSLETGHPQAVIEGSRISAARTAASAAVAVRLFAGDLDQLGMAVIGCGVISRNVVRFVQAIRPGLKQLTLYDADQERAAAFARDCLDAGGLRCCVADDPQDAVASAEVVCVATTASRPHLDLTGCRSGALILHISLRDLRPAAILASQNIVDDIDHVCRERTSIELAYQETGNTEFVDAAIGDIVTGKTPLIRDESKPLIFSPFGLGALDMAFAQRLVADARKLGLGTEIEEFLP